MQEESFAAALRSRSPVSRQNKKPLAFIFLSLYSCQSVRDRAPGGDITFINLIKILLVIAIHCLCIYPDLMCPGCGVSPHHNL